MITIISNPLNPLSNSYIDLNEAEEIVGTRIYSFEWDKLDDESKTKLLIWASDVLTRSFYWKGIKVDREQILAFPRYGISDEDGYWIDDDIFPRVVKQAVGDYVIYLSQHSPLISSPLQEGISELKVGTIMLKFDKDQILRGSKSSSNYEIPDYVKDSLAFLIESGMSVSGSVMELRRT